MQCIASVAWLVLDSDRIAAAILTRAEAHMLYGSGGQALDKPGVHVVMMRSCMQRRDGGCRRRQLYQQHR